MSKKTELNTLKTLHSATLDLSLIGPTFLAFPAEKPKSSTSEIEHTRDTKATGTIQPNPFEVFVLSGGVDGDGSQVTPFGTIQQGITAVSPGGIVHILAGTYPILSTILVDKIGITLKGYPGTLINLQAAIVPFIITGNGVTVDGLTITSDHPYAVEFIQIGGTNHNIINNIIFGPPQAVPSTGWIANRGFVTQIGNTANLLVKNNIFHSLFQPAYLNRDTTGYIINNVTFNTKGFVVDQSLFQFSGNSWGSPANTTDIALLVGTMTGSPYDPLEILTINNTSATISDLR